MNTSLHTLEAHVQAVNTNRLQQALRAEQIRLANARRPGVIGQMIVTIRTSMGGALITLGEKLSNQQATGQSAVHAPHARTTTA